MAKSKVVVRINGAEYSLKGDESEDYLFSIANFVDKKVKEILSGNPKHSTTSAAVLAALTIADELFKGRNEIEICSRKITELENRGIQLKIENEKIQKEYSSLLQEYNSAERTQQVSQESVNTLKDEYDRINKEYEKIAEENEELKRKNEDYELRILSTEDSIEELKNQLLDSKIELVRITKDFKDYKDIQAKRRSM